MIKKIIFILSFLSVSALGLVPINSDLLFKKVSPVVYRVKTALAPNAPMASYGSGFVVDAAQGWVVTNYHVVSDVVQKRNGFKNYVMISDIPFEAKILALDLVHDLALVQVDHKFKEAIQIRKFQPEQGEKIYSLGIPVDLNLSIVDGLFNGFRKIGPFDTMQMSTPINPGMSGGPTTDSEGKLVGVNVAGLFGLNNLTFAVPSKYVEDLIQVGRENPFPIGSFKALHSRIQEQLIKAQDELIQAALENAQLTEMGAWSIVENSKIFKCWMVKGQQDIKPESRKLDQTERICDIEHKVFLADNGNTLIFKIETVDLQNEKLNRFQFLNYADQVFNRSNWLLSQKPRVKEKDSTMSSYHCDDAQIWNEQNVPFQVSFCSRSYPEYPKLFDTTVKAAVIDPKGQKTLLFKIYLDGFTSENALKFVKEYVSHVTARK